MDLADAVKQAGASLREVMHGGGGLLVTAGAGMGVDSGLPDFRGPEGFWRAYPAYRAHRLRFEELANPTWFERDPELAWGFYGHRLNLYRQTVPHAGFGLLRNWMAAMPTGGFVFTSNVDGQFQKAGFADERVTEVHGSIHHLQCLRPACGGIWSAQDLQINVDPATFRATGALPRCPGCGGLARPNVLMFGDMNWDEQRTEEQHKRLDAWLETLRDKPLVVVECGAGQAIPTVRRFGEFLLTRRGARLVRINVREPEGPHGALGLPCGASEALRRIGHELKV